MKQNQAGFTLIELIVVIVILGILAATALPKFIDLRSDAGNSAAAGVAGAMNSAGNINYGGAMARGATHTSVVRVSAAEACSALATRLMSSFDVTPFIITGNVPAACASGSTVACSIIANPSTADSKSATATVICTG